jgi:hypothetical protein
LIPPALSEFGAADFMDSGAAWWSDFRAKVGKLFTHTQTARTDLTKSKTR